VAITANTAANRANAASSSRTKYVCSKTTIDRNPHIHFRPWSVVFIFPLVPFFLAKPRWDSDCPPRYVSMRFFHFFRCAQLSQVPGRFTCPIRQEARPECDGTEGTFWATNESASTRSVNKPVAYNIENGRVMLFRKISF